MDVGGARVGNAGATVRHVSQVARGAAVALVFVAALTFGAAAACGAGAGLPANGSFEEGVAAWQVTASRPGFTVEVVSGAHGGVRALKVSGRRWRTETVGQDLASALREAGAGKCYVLRFWVRSDAAASVRGLLQVSDDEGKRDAIVAERVVRELGDWVLVRGSWAVSWKGELKQATLTFDVSQVPEGIFPDFSLDDVALEPDADGDRLSDREEADLGTNPASADTDGDGMTDDWECEHTLDPRRADAEDDADGDGFTNGQEYWAATDPREAASSPAKPSNPDASADTRAVLRYLALLPSHKDHRVVVGQHVTDVDPEYQRDVVGLYEETGKWPGLVSFAYDGVRQPLQVESVNPVALAWWKAGGLVKIKFCLSNPWTGGNENDRPARGEPDYVDLRGLIDPSRSRDPAAAEANRKAHEVYLGWLDGVAAGLTELRDAGVVVLWRPTSEMNGRWFWWGGRPREDYIAMWRHMHDYLSREKGLNNLLWVYESDSSVHGTIPIDYYYPGDDVVDVVGHNFYHDTWDLPYDAEYVYRRYPKVYAFPQAGSETVRDGSWDNMTYVRMIQARYPRASFFAAWNSFNGVPKPGIKAKSLGPNRAQVVCAIAGDRNARELMNHPWIVTRDELAWRARSAE